MEKGYPKRILAKIKVHLEAEKRHLQKRLSQIDESDPYKDPDHVNDNADIGLDVREEIAHQQSEGNREQLKKQLNDVNAALSRIEQGTYGFCTKCGAMIDTDRLSSNPLASLCIKCAKTT
jgi:RNA polymerase-binding protein DksA